VEDSAGRQQVNQDLPDQRELDEDAAVAPVRFQSAVEAKLVVDSLASGIRNDLMARVVRKENRRVSRRMRSAMKSGGKTQIILEEDEVDNATKKQISDQLQIRKLK